MPFKLTLLSLENILLTKWNVTTYFHLTGDEAYASSNVAKKQNDSRPDDVGIDQPQNVGHPGTRSCFLKLLVTLFN